jgi:GDP-L-fucose synthase
VWHAARLIPRKRLDISRIKAMGWSPRIALDAGLRGAYRDFLSRFQPGKA